MRTVCRPWLLAWLLALPAHAQTVVASHQDLASGTPEAWAMRYLAGTTLMTSFGQPIALSPWRTAIAAELGRIPALSESQRQVGFGGSKTEDLNKSPVFGRLRVAMGLPSGWLAELGYTPPVRIHGSRPRALVAMAVGRRVVERDAFTLSIRALGQSGKVEGDITCPARLAGVTDLVANPYGCRAPSKDVFAADYQGADATLAWAAGGWGWHASAGIARTRLSVQVDARVFDVNDRSSLASRGNLRWFTVGARRDLGARWSLAAEILYVPLEVRRPPGFDSRNDSLASVRVLLRYVPD